MSIRWVFYALILVLALDTLGLFLPLPVFGTLSVTYEFGLGSALLIGLFLYVSYESARGAKVEKRLTTQTAGLDASIQSLRRTVNDSASETEGKVASIEGTVAKMGESVASHEGRLSGIEKEMGGRFEELGAKISAIQGAVARNEKALDRMSDAGSEVGGKVRVVEGRVSKIEVGVTGIEETLSRIEATESEIRGSLEGAGERISKVEEMTSETGGKVGGLEKRSSEMGGRVTLIAKNQGRISKIERNVSKIEGRLARIAKTEGRISRIEKSVSKIEVRVSKAARPGAKSARARGRRPRRAEGTEVQPVSEEAPKVELEVQEPKAQIMSKKPVIPVTGSESLYSGQSDRDESGVGEVEPMTTSEASNESVLTEMTRPTDSSNNGEAPEIGLPVKEQSALPQVEPEQPPTFQKEETGTLDRIFSTGHPPLHPVLEDLDLWLRQGESNEEAVTKVAEKWHLPEETVRKLMHAIHLL